MRNVISRRTRILCLATIALCRLAHADPPPTPEPVVPSFQLHDLGHGVWAAIATPNSRAGSNSGFVIGTDAVLVIDSFVDPAAAEELLHVIHDKTPLPIRYVVNTHYHLDHVAGNGIYQAAGAVILAQRNVRRWERTENLKFFGDKITPVQSDMVHSLVLPTIVYDSGIDLYLGDRKVIVRMLPGHTGGDSTVVIPDADVVFTGDMFWNHCLPNLIDADTRAQIASNKTFETDYPGAVFVPGHGETGSSSDVAAFAQYLGSLRNAVAQAQTHKTPRTEFVNAVLPGLKQTYGSWAYFDYFVKRNIEQTADELGHVKRVPVP